MSEQIINNAEQSVVTTVHPDFHAYSKAISDYYNSAVEAGTVAYIKVDKGVLYKEFSEGFAPEDRQYYDCSCCKAFLDRFGSLVVITGDNKLKSPLWNAEVDPFFAQSMKNMASIVEAGQVSNIFYYKEDALGVDEQGGHNHFYIERDIGDAIPASKTAGELRGASREDFRIFSETVGKAKVDVIEAVMLYFQNDAKLANANKFRKTLEKFHAFKVAYDAVTDRAERRNMIWRVVAGKDMGVLRIGLSVIGEFVDAVQEGVSYDVARNKFLAMTKPEDYLHAKAAPAAGNIQRAEMIFKALGIESALVRRPATLDDIRSEQKVWLPKAPEAPAVPASLFGHLTAKDAPVDAASTLPVIDGGNITYERFLAEVLPQAEQMTVTMPRHRQNFVGISTAVDPEAKPLVSWDDEEDRNPLASYAYVDGSYSLAWNVSMGKEVNVTAIVVQPEHWNPKDDGTRHLMVLEGMVDINLKQIPLGGNVLRHELHEVRATLERFFMTGQLQKLPEGQMPICGVGIAGKGVPMTVHITVNKGKVRTKYHIDRTN